METNLAPVTKLVSGTTNLESSEMETRGTPLREALRLESETIRNILLRCKEDIILLEDSLESEKAPKWLGPSLIYKPFRNYSLMCEKDTWQIDSLVCEEALNILPKNIPLDKRNPNPFFLGNYNRSPRPFRYEMFVDNFEYEWDQIGLEDRRSFCGYFDTVKPVQEETSLAWESGKDNMQKMRELFILDANLCLLQDKEVRTPLHWGAVTGRVNFLKQNLSMIVTGFPLGDIGKNMVTVRGETTLYLAVMKSRTDTARDLMENLHIIKLANTNDNISNTIFHLETTAKLTQISIVESGVKNCPHSVHLSIPSSSLTSTLQSKNGSQLLPQLSEITSTNTISISRRLVENSLKMDKTPANCYHSKLYNHRQSMHNDGVMEEGLQNIHNTMTIASALIATVSFTAGIYASSGVHQEGMTSRKSSLRRTTAYMVFLVCNNVAFFSSLGITAALFSGISFSRKSMIKLLAVMQKIMWVSLFFMVAAYIVAAFMI